ncbi:hypothetical protein A9Q81_11825 [Gammaproteobacteria bacterium 42_54_T18]|nr:hypothetical protein A9Q81_11825 [Gammaproteobacteria bacterium 42_54_T18]
MARSRNIKHTFFKDDELAELPFENRLYFIGLWTQADCKGRIEYRPKRIKAEIFPYDDGINIDELTVNLSKYRFIRIYSVQGRRYIEIANFLKHQNPHKNERDKGSAIPPPEEGVAVDLTNKGLQKSTESIGTGTDLIGSAPADSCFLNPESCSLNPDSSGQTQEQNKSVESFQSEAPSVEPPEIQLDILTGDPEVLSETQLTDLACIKVIDHLNEKAGKNFTYADSHKEHIKARLNEGHTLEKVLQVIDLKVDDWLNDKEYNRFLQPGTLFNGKKFNNYVGQVGCKPAPKKTEFPVHNQAKSARAGFANA